MANSNSSDNEKILVKVDQNNLLYIDPNSVIDREGNVLPRGIKHENLVMFVNLEADLVPRSILRSENDRNTLVSVARGTINFLRNQKGGDYDTKWTETFYQQEKTLNIPFGNTGTFSEIKYLDDYYDDTAQSFGIESINVSIKGANSIPNVNITFIDVRGKTLFESPENSPYKAFFHLPWPIFYLTLKGYYGKAIRYKLHLVKISTKFNDSTGNFEILANFIGSTSAFLSDISMGMVLNSPYMYFIENTRTVNNDTQREQVTISRSSKGYSILKSIYSEYKRKGLVKENFPIKTVRELIVNAQNLDKILEEKILNDKLTPDVFIGMDDFEKKINNFELAVNAWAKEYLLSASIIENGVNYYELKTQNKKSSEKILGFSGQTLQKIVENNSNALKDSHLFSQKMVDSIKSDKTGKSNFSVNNILSKPIVWSDRYYRQNRNNQQFEVSIDLLISDIKDIIAIYNKEKDNLQKYIEQQMNIIFLTDEKGFGFEPTLKNIFAVILANAEVYIRLMKDVHNRAFEIGQERSEKIAGLTKETAYDKPIYPWPEIKKTSEKQKQNVIAYPGDSSLIDKLQSNDPRLWPEVEFVEKYVEVATNKSDPNSEKEGGIANIDFVLPNDDNNNNTQPINALSIVPEVVPYIDKSPSSFLYEIWERATHFSIVDSFDNLTLKELSDVEFDNIKNSIQEDNEIIEILSKNVTSVDALRNLLRSYSPFDRYPYYVDELPSIPYMIDALEFPYRIEENKNVTRNSTTGTFDNLKRYLQTYTPESYRKNIYPFNSDLYLSYLNQTTYNDDEFKFSYQFEVDTSDSLIQTSKNIDFLKSGFNKSILSNKLSINNSDINILNTPFFHRQIYYDFINQSSYGKYVSSAYLFLNSLPFIDLQDKVIIKSTTNNAIQNGVLFATNTQSKVKFSTIFREIGATHFIPYHLICKWGSIYHRYKRYILDDVDILGEILNPNNGTRTIDGELFFNNKETSSIYTTFNVNQNSVTYSGQIDVGIHPFYDAVFHQVINGYNHYDVLSGDTSYSQNVNDKKILSRLRLQSNNLKFWTNLVDNSKYISSDNFYTLLPCDGGNKNINLIVDFDNALVIDNADTFDTALQKNFRLLWEDEFTNDNFDNLLFPTYNQYHLTFDTNSLLNNTYAIGEDYKKIIDLLGTFSPKLLEEFENIFLEFASEKLNNQSNNFKLPNLKYSKFQDLLKDICTIEKTNSDKTDVDELIFDLKTKQINKIDEISKVILSDTNKLKITLGNPKELDLHVLYGFTDVEPNNSFTTRFFNQNQLNEDNQKLIQLYLGEDFNNHYQNFFIVNNIELNEENILQFRPLIYIYAGYIRNGGINSSSDFKEYIRTNILQNANSIPGFESRRLLFLTYLINNFSSIKQKIQTRTLNRITTGYNNDSTKLELYNYFKSFNDKWVAGNSIGQRLLLEEFLFLDKANKDIGDELYINLDRLLSLADPKNHKQSLLGMISLLIQNTGLDMRAMPAYVNFYGNNVKNKNRITPSKNVANNLFGTFLEVDYQESSPKIIIQYVGHTSKHLDLQSKKYKFADDSFNLSSTNNNPILITGLQSFEQIDLSQSNRAVAFEVSFGDQNQSIFKGVQLDQSSIKNTSESMIVLENMARTESGAGAYNIDISLFDYYRQASYTCDVTCMGNAMIQPTMFFYLKNIPMFKGSYWITEVTHNIKANNFTTTFKGTRIPFKSLPDPKDSFASSYRVLFDRIRRKALAKINRSSLTPISPVTVNYNGKTFVTDYVKNAQGEDFEKIKVSRVGVTEQGVPYNGFLNERYIQLVNYTYPNKSQKEWLRARVVLMGGPLNPINDNREFIISTQYTGNKLKWETIKNSLDNDNTNVFATQFKLYDNNTLKNIATSKTFFVNPEKKKHTEVKFNVTNNIYSGPLDIGPNFENSTSNIPYGISMTKSLMKKLDLFEGDIVYFVME